MESCPREQDPRWKIGASKEEKGNQIKVTVWREKKIGFNQPAQQGVSFLKGVGEHFDQLLVLSQVNTIG